jgi:signal transduction histidine kinase
VFGSDVSDARLGVCCVDADETRAARTATRLAAADPGLDVRAAAGLGAVDPETVAVVVTARAPETAVDGLPVVGFADRTIEGPGVVATVARDGPGSHAALAARVRAAADASGGGEADATLPQATDATALLDRPADCVLELAPDGTVRSATPAVAGLAGAGPAALAGTDAFELLHPADRPAARALFDDLLATGGERRLEVRMPDGGAPATAATDAADAAGAVVAPDDPRRVVLRMRHPSSVPGVEGVVVNARDVTARRAGEASVHWHRAVVRSMDEGVYVMDGDATFRFVDHRAAGLALDPSDWVGEPVDRLAETGVLSPAAVDEIETAVRAVAAGRAEETRLLLEPSIPPGVEFVELRLRPLAVGGTERVLGTTRDVSERERSARDLADRNDRLEALASAISHDLRSPLNVVRGSLETGTTGDGDGSVELGREAHGRSLRALDRTERLLEDLLTLAREDRRLDGRESVSLGRAAERAWRTATEDAGPAAVDAASLEVVGDRTLSADPSRLGQLLGNLLRNAIQHGGPGVTVTVEATADGFAVADDGPGLDPTARERAFETGYTTRPDGTGLGLDIVRRVAKAHGWSVDATESAAGGARFEVTGVGRPD